MKSNDIAKVFMLISIVGVLIVGCNQVVSEPPPTPDVSLVWSDDFEDGTLDGWERLSIQGGDFVIEEGALKAEVGELGFFNSLIEHPNSITSGTLSYDFYIPDYSEGDLSYPRTMVGLFNNISLKGDYIENPVYRWWENPDLHSLALDYSSGVIYLTIISGGKSIVFAQYPNKDYLGWLHMDATLDDHGKVLIYLNGEQIFEYTDERLKDTQYFSMTPGHTSHEMIDNIVVRDKVIEITPLDE